MSSTAAPGVKALTPELISFLQSGLIVEIATRDARRITHVVQVFGARFDAAAMTMRLWVSTRGTERTRADISNNGEVAVIFSRPHDNKSFQLKGKVLRVDDETPADVAVREDYRKLIEDALSGGILRSGTRRWGAAPCIVITATIREIFEQTPGPSAGRKLSA